MSRFIGGGYVVYFVAAMLEMPADAAIVTGWWTPVAIALSFGPGFVLFAASFGHYRGWVVNAASLACGVGYLIAVTLWFFAWNGGHESDERGTWLVLFPGLASLAMVLGRWPWGACLHLLVACPVVLTANGLGRADRYGHWLSAGEALWCIAFSSPFVVAAIMAVRAGDLLKSSRERVAEAAASAAARLEIGAVQGRYERLVHDRVLEPMITVRPGPTDPQVARQARQVIDDLENLSDDPGAPVALFDLVSLVRGAVGEIDATIPVVVTSSLERLLPVVPADAARDIAAAAAQATRNSVRHAGPDAMPRMQFEAGTAFVRVTVLDDGCGFDPASVPLDRRGLAASIRDRMSAIGGVALVESAPGEGTRIVLEWPWPR